MMSFVFVRHLVSYQEQSQTIGKTSLMTLEALCYLRWKMHRLPSTMQHRGAHDLHIAMYTTTRAHTIG